MVARIDIPVNRFVVSFGCDHFWRKIIRSSAERPSDIGNIFRKSEIGDLDVTMSVQEQILRLQISVDDILLVKILEGQRHFGGVELGDGVGEALRKGIDN